MPPSLRPGTAASSADKSVIPDGYPTGSPTELTPFAASAVVVLARGPTPVYYQRTASGYHRARLSAES